MKTDERDRILEERVTASLNEGLGEIGTPAAGRLAAMRAAAVELPRGRRFWFAAPRRLAAGGLATAVAMIVAVSLWMSPVRSTQPVVAITNPDDVELLTSRDRIELYQDLDFYRWLDDGGRNGV